MNMQMSQIQQRVGALCFSLGGVQYLLAEWVSAAGWHSPAYSYSQNYISDLGIPLRSPLHSIMNGGFALEGGLFFIACCLLLPLLNGSGRWLFLLCGLLHGAGGVMIALFHSGSAGKGVTPHEIGAVLAIAGGNLCLITVGWMMHARPGFTAYAWLSLSLGCLGLACMAAITAALFPIGIIERASVYPITLWQILTGVFLLTRSSAVKR